jgi:crotonobetainyl-CoA:carnitine CoA-transferase CaiB-like acyl-CoA transferase
MPAALDGIRVIDLSTGVAGPMAAMLLADFGADVVKVERPGGDPSRSRPGFAMWNRNKRGVVIDLEQESGRRRLAELLDASDICIAQGIEEDLRAAGADPAAVTARNPGLVYLAVPPVHDTVPWAGGQESNALLSAFMGVALRQSSFDGGPVFLVYPQLLYDQAIWAAAAVVAALVERESSGLGQVVTVGGAHGTLIAMALTVDPAQPQQPATVGPGGPHPMYTRYHCADGQWLFLGALTPKFQQAALVALGLEDILADPRIAGDLEQLLTAGNRDWVRKRFVDVFGSRDREAWIGALRAVDCPASPVLDREDWIDHPQIAAIGMRVELDDPERGHLVMPGCPVHMDVTAPSVRRPAPCLGEHNAQIVGWDRRAPTTDTRWEKPAGTGPLAGVRVLDLGNILAGPFAGTLLAELGAEVVKVEIPAGDSWRDRGWIYNRGQRGLAIDLQSSAGRAAFYQLVGSVDVVVDNYRPGVLRRLGIDYEQLRQVRPDLIAWSITAFGTVGPLATEAGFDPLLQAMSGMMSAQGGDSEPVFHTSAVNDVSSAALTVLGIGLALFHRERTGEGQRGGVTLAGAASLMQCEELLRLPGRQPSVQGGRDFTGPHALRRFYATADGWICLEDEGADSDQRLRQSGLVPPELGDAELAVAGVELAQVLERALAGLPRDEALARLSTAGIPAAPARWIAEVAADPALQAWDVFQTFDRRDGTFAQVPGRYARFSRTQRTGVTRPPGIGEHSTEVLAGAGVPKDEVEELISKGVVRQGGPMVHRTLAAYR